MLAFHSTNKHLYGVNKKGVELCLQMPPNRTRPPLELIISEFALERVQIDLVDMRHQLDRQYKWILHIKDHFSKYP
jgi:hypothetical protein